MSAMTTYPAHTTTTDGERTACVDSSAAESSHRQPIGFFVHHQGEGHARRINALIAQMPPRPVYVFCARPELIDQKHCDVTVITLPDFHGQPPATPRLLAQPGSSALDCAPLGVSALRIGMGRLAAWFHDHDPALLVVDVSAEVALLARICSVPCVSVRMHGNRQDAAHEAAYSASVGMLAPFDQRLEQPDYPSAFRDRTCYIGGLVNDFGGGETTTDERDSARAGAGLPAHGTIIVVLSGGGGLGANIGSLTLAARAFPDALWLVVGQATHRGHETEFGNLRRLGWVDDTRGYIAAADIVVGSGGDNTVHEVCRIGRPFVCIPEWCYYAEQHRKAEALAHLGAAIYAPVWPGDFSAWRDVIARAAHCDIDLQRGLVNDDAAREGAAFIDGLARSLWAGP